MVVESLAPIPHQKQLNDKAEYISGQDQWAPLVMAATKLDYAVWFHAHQGSRSDTMYGMELMPACTCIEAPISKELAQLHHVSMWRPCGKCQVLVKRPCAVSIRNWPRKPPNFNTPDMYIILKKCLFYGLKIVYRATRCIVWAIRCYQFVRQPGSRAR